MSPLSPIIAGFLLFGCAPQTIAPAAYPDIAPGRYVKTTKVGDFNRRYILRVPKSYDKSKPTPAVLMLHGYTGSADRVERTSGIAEVAEKEGWLAVFPQGVGDPPGWNAGFINLTGKDVDDVEFTDEMLDEIERTVNVDKDRIYIAGHSNGAMMAHRLASKMSSRIAAIAAVAGIVGISKTSMIEPPANSVSVLLIHGMIDPLVGYEAASNAMLRGVPVYEGAKWWAKAIGASEKPVKLKNGTYRSDSWGLGRNGTEVRLLTITEGGHEWPTRGQLGQSAAEVIIEFFKTHPKQR